MSDAIILQPGPLDAEWIEDVFSVHHVAQLQPGTYTLNRKISWSAAHSGLRFVCPEGGAVIVPGWAPDSALADDPTNAMIQIVGAIDTSACNSYLAATAAARDRQITLHDAVTLAAGRWLAISGCNLGDDELGGSVGAAIVIHELARVASVVAASVTVPLAWPTIQHHASGTGNSRSVTGVLPAVDIRIAGVEFAPGASLLACAVYASYAYGLDFADLRGGGFSHALIRATGCQRIRAERLHDTGGGNGIVYFDSCQRFAVRGITSEPGATRRAAYGVPQAKVTLRTRCTEGLVDDFQICHGTIGVKTWGSRNVAITRGTIADFDGTDVCNGTGGGRLDPETTSPFGVGCDTGSNPLTIADFGRGLLLDDLVFIDCGDHATAEDGTYTLLFHDTEESTIGSIEIINVGRSSSAAGPDGIVHNLNGLYCQDINGRLESLNMVGVRHNTFSGAGCDIDIGTLKINANPGVGFAQAKVFMATSIMPYIARMHVQNGVTLYQGSTWLAGTPDWNFRMGEYNNDGIIGRNIVVAWADVAVNDVFASPTAGNCVTFTGSGAAAGERRIAVSGAAATGLVGLVVQGAPTQLGTGAMLVALGGGSAVVDGACDPGDILKTAANGLLTVDNSAVAPVAKFRACRKTAGKGRAEVTAL